MMYKKLLAILLTLAMLFSLAACGNASLEDVLANVPGANNSDVNEDNNEDNNKVESGKEDNESKNDKTPAKVDFDEVVIVDDENCTFKITAIDADNDWGYTLKAYLENKTDAELMFSLDEVSVNGFMCDPYWAATVTAGMKANEEISFYESDFELNGITDVTEIEFTLTVYDYNDYSVDDFVHDTFTIYPLGEDAVQPYERTPVDGEIVVFDNEYCTMIITGENTDNDWYGYALNVYLENKTDKNLYFSADDVAVNGFMCDPYWGAEVAAGKRCNTMMTWYEEDITDNDITEIESITLPITVHDADDWYADYIIDETFTVNP